MNTRLYYQDPYLRSTLCKVVSVERASDCVLVTVDRTVFYPECGGQCGDRGKLGPFDVLDTKKADNGDSVLVLGPECDVTVGSENLLELDWDHRFEFMVKHTAQHLLSGLLYSLFNIGTLSVHMGKDGISIEVDTDHVGKENIDILIENANRVIAESHPVCYHTMSLEEARTLGLRRSIKVDDDVRIVEIEGVDRIACGGVHVSDTSQIRLVSYISSERIRGHERLFFICSDDAVRRLSYDENLISSVTSFLGCSPQELLQKVTKLTQTVSSCESRVQELGKTLACSVLSSYGEKAFFETDLELSYFLDEVNRREDLALCIVNDTKWLIVLKGKYSCVDFSLIRSGFARFDAKGGGRSPVFQGVLSEKSASSFIEFVSGLVQ